ncbi:MAG: N-acetylmuramoyl-L-alanine amidase family protein [Halothermotrichaceae bacterium]
MKKIISFIIVIVVFMIFVVQPYSLSKAYAFDKELQEKVIDTAKIAAVLYLIGRVSNYIGQGSNNKRQEDRGIIDLTDIKNDKLNNKVIVIDPGHGGHDTGAIGQRGLKEKDLNLEIALRLYQLLKQNTEADIYLTRGRDEFVSLNQRSTFASSKDTDVYISIHNNADITGKHHGTETYAHYSTSKNTWALAWYIHESLVDNLGFQDRGLKADNFHVIRETADINSILLEIGFVSNLHEESILKQPKTQDAAASAIYEGIVKYFNENK